MKNLFLFLLFTSVSFGQTTLANKLRITGNVTDNTSAKVNVQDAVGNVNTIAKIDLQDVLSFANEASFPTTGMAGKLYVAASSPTKIYIWNGTIYNEVGGVPSLLPFLNTKTYKTDDFVSYKINNQNYIFKSKTDNNTSVPSLIYSIKPWINFQYGGIFKGTWNNTTTYVTNDVLLRDGYLYFCLTNNTSSDPIFLTPPNWLKIGVYKGVHSVSYIGGYEIGDVVIDNLNNVFISNLRFNNFTLSQPLNHGWDIVSDKKTTIAFWGDSLTFGTGSYGNSDYPSVFSNLTGLNVWNGGVPGETSTEIKTRFLAEKSKWDLPTIFWAGRNNNSNTAVVKADIAEMVSKLGHNRFLVIGIIKSTGDVAQPIDGLNLDLKNLYGERFIDAQPYLLQYFDATITQDVADNLAGRIAWSLRSDWLHLNNKSYKLIAEIIASKINFLVNNSNETNSTLISSGIRVEDNLVPLEKKKSVEIGYRKDLDFGFIQCYDRINNLAKKFSIQTSGGSELALIENGGSLSIGDKTVIKGIDDILTLKGKSIGNSVYLNFKNSDNLTRGNVGYQSVGNNNFLVNNDVGDVYIIGQKVFSISTNTGTPNEIVRNIDIVVGVNNPTTTILTSTQLNTQYPTAKTNFKVYCTSIAAGAMVYEKTPTQWIGTAVFVP